MTAWPTFRQSVSGKHGVRWAAASALTAAVALLLTTSGSAAPGAAPERAIGWKAPLGRGDVTSFADLEPSGAPRTVGIAISGSALTSLPPEPSDHHHCFDRDGDGVTSHATECAHTHEFVVPLPDAVARRDDVPFKWVLLNWNMHGHMPPGIYDVPHFDVHFYMQSIEDVFAIHDGPCGPEMVNCEHFALAKAPLADGMMHPDFQDLDAVAPAMGNHLIDMSGHEFHGMPFTMSWIYGVYGGRVTFYEQMIALDFLQGRPNVCAPIKATPAVAETGYYPTQRCVRYDASSDAYVVSLERFIHRAAS
jgi:hypothetical protein